MKEYTVKYILNKQEEEQLQELLKLWQQYRNDNGDTPFEDWTIEHLFQAIMEAGSEVHIKKQIKSDQLRWGLITAEQFFNDEFTRTPEQKDPEPEQEEKDMRECPICGKKYERSEMTFSKDCHGITYRLICCGCWDHIESTKGYDGEYYTEADENIDYDY